MSKCNDKNSLIRLFELFEAVKTGGPWPLSSGKESDFYVDVRKVVTQPAGIELVSSMMLPYVWDACQSAAPPAQHFLYLVSGGAAGGILLGGLLHLLAKHDAPYVRGLVVRDRPKGHGTGQLLEGCLPPPSQCKPHAMIIDDVLTGGGSLLRFADAVKDHLDVKSAVVVVDREEGGAGAVSGYFKLNRILTRQDLEPCATKEDRRVDATGDEGTGYWEKNEDNWDEPFTAKHGRRDRPQELAPRPDA
jgi:orotate phosphoribosyltransferase